MKTLAQHLHASRKANPATGKVEYVGPMVDLVTELETACLERGFNLSRWETGSKRCGWVRTVTYVAHHGPRTASSFLMPDEAIVA